MGEGDPGARAMLQTNPEDVSTVAVKFTWGTGRGDEDPDTGKMAGRKAETAETIRVGRGFVCGGGLTVGGYFPRVQHELERTDAGDIA